MNKRYMDFVPTKKQAPAASSSTSVFEEDGAHVTVSTSHIKTADGSYHSTSRTTTYGPAVDGFVKHSARPSRRPLTISDENDDATDDYIEEEIADTVDDYIEESSDNYLEDSSDDYLEESSDVAVDSVADSTKYETIDSLDDSANFDELENLTRELSEADFSLEDELDIATSFAESDNEESSDNAESSGNTELFDNAELTDSDELSDGTELFDSDELSDNAKSSQIPAAPQKSFEEEYAEAEAKYDKSQQSKTTLNETLTVQDAIDAANAVDDYDEEEEDCASEDLESGNDFTSEDYSQTSATYGIIEDYVPVDKKNPAFIKPNFTNAAVEKRPLSTPAAYNYTAEELAQLKVAKSANPAKLVADAAAADSNIDKKKSTLATPKRPHFINLDRIEKRPLSKTDYRSIDQAKAVALAEAEETSGPVTIIDNSGKDSRFGLIITIAITILLGAAVGTIAFLVFPK